MSMERETITGIDRYAEIKGKLYEYAVRNDDLRAIIAIGSSTRKETPADEYSDLDLILVTKKPEKWLSREYHELLGEVRISFIEPTLGGGMERRSIYDEDKDLDMIVFSPEQFEKALREGVAGWVMNRGYSFIYDADSFSELAAQYVTPAVIGPEMTEKEYHNLVNDFYFHNIWACKKLQRGELWSAKMCIDAYLKNILLKMIEQYQIVVSGADVWHDGRFLERWADPTIKEELRDCFAHYDETGCRNALFATHTLFSRLASFVACKKGFEYPIKAKACAAEYLNRFYGNGEKMDME